MTEREITPTQNAYLELKEEREGMQDGYRFLDEKRFVLASEILAQLSRYEEESAAFRALYRDAVTALRAAVSRHGLEGLAFLPAATDISGRMQLSRGSVLGVPVQGLQCEIAGFEPPRDPVEPSPEAARCRALFRGLIPSAAHLAATIGNLERLRQDYARTARRARALEDVLLPEIDDTLRAIDAALEELEREEAIRVRRAGR